MFYRLDYSREGRGTRSGITLGLYLRRENFNGGLLAISPMCRTHIVTGELSVDMISYANSLGFRVTPLMLE